MEFMDALHVAYVDDYDSSEIGRTDVTFPPPPRRLLWPLSTNTEFSAISHTALKACLILWSTCGGVFHILELTARSISFIRCHICTMLHQKCGTWLVLLRKWSSRAIAEQFYKKEFVNDVDGIDDALKGTYILTEPRNHYNISYRL